MRNDAKNGKKLKGNLAAGLLVPKNNRHDVHNYIEFFCDAFEGKWYDNDKQIKLIVCQEYSGDKFIFDVYKIMKESILNEFINMMSMIRK